MKILTAVCLLFFAPNVSAQRVDVAALQSRCLPAVPLTTLSAIIRVESGGNSCSTPRLMWSFPDCAKDAVWHSVIEASLNGSVGKNRQRAQNSMRPTSSILSAAKSACTKFSVKTNRKMAEWQEIFAFCLANVSEHSGNKRVGGRLIWLNTPASMRSISVTWNAGPGKPDCELSLRSLRHWK